MYEGDEVLIAKMAVLAKVIVASMELDSVIVASMELDSVQAYKSERTNRLVKQLESLVEAQ